MSLNNKQTIVLKEIVDFEFFIEAIDVDYDSGDLFYRLVVKIKHT